VATILVVPTPSGSVTRSRTALVGPGLDVIEVDRGQEVRDVAAARQPDLVILDMQIANMAASLWPWTYGSKASAGRAARRVDLLLARSRTRPVSRPACRPPTPNSSNPSTRGRCCRTVKRILAERASV